MKPKKLLLMMICMALSVQCSDDTGEPDAISGKPLPEGTDSPEAPFGDNSITILGYSDVSNARLIVNTVDSVIVAPEYAFVADWVQGLGDPGRPGSILDSNTTDVFFDFSTHRESIDGRPLLIKFPESSLFTLLCVSDDWGTLYLPHWDLKYSIEYCPGCDSAWSLYDITINGTGKGSHILDLYNFHRDVYKTAEVSFEFKGTQFDRGYNATGSFSIIETSAEPGFNLAIYGTLTVEFD